MSNYVTVRINISSVLQCDGGLNGGDWLYEGVGGEDGDEDGDVDDGDGDETKATITSFCLGSRGAGWLGGKITPSIWGSKPPSLEITYLQMVVNNIITSSPSPS